MSLAPLEREVAASLIFLAATCGEWVRRPWLDLGSIKGRLPEQFVTSHRGARV